jgi:hypothetical protein
LHRILAFSNLYISKLEETLQPPCPTRGKPWVKGDTTSTHIFCLFGSTLHSTIEIHECCDAKRVSLIRYTHSDEASARFPAQVIALCRRHTIFKSLLCRSSSKYPESFSDSDITLNGHCVREENTCHLSEAYIILFC